MPMIDCPECGKLISSRMNKCPFCGKQIPMSARYPQFYENNNFDSNTTGICESQNAYKSEILQNNKTPISQEYSAPSPQPVKMECKASCPRCGSTNISYQREQTASFGAGTNKVVIQQAKKSKGCLYWLFIGWWWKPLYWLLIGWWWKALFGGRTKSGLNFNASKSINRTMAVCQNCGNSWKV